MRAPSFAPQSEVVEQGRALQGEVRAALAHLPSDDPDVVDAVWRGEALGTLLWALQLAELPGYDQPFDTDEVAAAAFDGRPAARRRRDRPRARVGAALALARPHDRRPGGRLVELPERFASFDQLIAATAMRGFEQGLLPTPMRGDFRAYGKVYRHLAPEQHAEAHSIAAERHHALAWLCGEGESWADVPLDT